MSHQKSGTIRKTRKWDAVVNRFREYGKPAYDDADQIIALTLDAAAPELIKAGEDVGLCYTFHLLNMLVCISSKDGWHTLLGDRVLKNNILFPNSSIFDLTSQLQLAIDKYIDDIGYSSTDISEMAQRAIGDAMSSIVVDKPVNLFNNDESISYLIKDLATPAGASRFWLNFLSKFTVRLLTLHLIQMTIREFGSLSLRDENNISHFNYALITKCIQSMRNAADLCQNRSSGAHYQDTFDYGNTSDFITEVLRTFIRDLKKQEDEP